MNLKEPHSQRTIQSIDRKIGVDNMKGFKKIAILCFTAILMLNMMGCQNDEKKENSSGTPQGDTNSMDTAVDWETKEYEDTYLKYEIPSNWELNPNYSNEGMRLVFFASSEASSGNPSNVNVQVTSLKSNSKNLDYGDASIQDEFHDFLISEAGLPNEAKNGVFKVFQTADFYVYTISFSRVTDSGIKVQQTAYIPVGLDYSIIIWATDWKDNTSPSVEEVAMHLCNTLQIKDPPVN